MARYIIISNLTDEGARTLKKNPERVKEVNKIPIDEFIESLK